MTGKIFRNIILVSVIVLLFCLIIIMGGLYEYLTSVIKAQLEAQTVLAAQGVANEGISYFDGLNIEGFRITLVAPDGTVLYDSQSDASIMENHSMREEIMEAFKNASGESVRYSSTLDEMTHYRAQHLPDGSVLRLSTVQPTIWALFLAMLQPIIIIFAVTMVISVFLAQRLARRIVEPLNRLDLDNPLENDTYDELTPLLTRIERQHRQISGQIGELRRKQDEFSAVTESLSEGLILINEYGTVLSINPAACRLFGTDASWVGSNIQIIDRSLTVRELMQTALSGRRSEMVVERNAGQYQLNASPIISGGKVTGAVIMSFDITEKAFAEKLRREFSANVSHELKTPLHSIMGSAELIENNLVKQADMPLFVRRIHTEARRLVTLIDDIIRLSQLDEGIEIPVENVRLRDLADEVVQALASKAGGITIQAAGENAVVNGSKQLLYEIIYNLCDNAINYNVEGGQVYINIEENPDNVTLIVRDTGIGIPPEHQSRIFERFYRVDKSHSRQTGGTGLGLSIVKHAAAYHKAEIELESKVGVGTSVKVIFPV